jgi:hypothetical protein
MMSKSGGEDTGKYGLESLLRQAKNCSAVSDTQVH